MIRLGLRLTVAGGREAAIRLVLIAAAVALGVAMLLAAVGGMSGVVKQSDRYGWANAALDPAGPGDGDPLWWQLRIDTYDRTSLGRVDLAATGPGSPVPPGLSRLPAPGEYFASPRLQHLLATEPAGQLRDRFPGHLAGTVGKAALPAPDSLVAVVGYTPEELSRRTGATRVSRIPQQAPAHCPGGCWAGIPASGLQLILAVVAAALIFPLLILVGSATRLAAARREQRFAAMRLVGATPRQVAVVSAVESTASSVAGTAAGVALFYALRGWLAGIPLTGAPLFPSDLSPGVWGLLGVVAGVPLGSALAARFALRRVRMSPLGVSRRVTPGSPRAYRLIPLGFGVAELAYFVGRRPATTDGQVLAFLPGILMVMAGLVLAGPWLTMVASRLLAGRARRPAALIAARRLADNPAAGFRAVSGLVLALFVTSVAVGIMGTLAADADGSDPGSTRLMELNFRGDGPVGAVLPAGLTAMAGVRGAAVVRMPPAAEQPSSDGAWVPTAVASCADIARIPGATPCRPGARTAWVSPDLIATADHPWTARYVTGWPAATIDEDRLTGLPAESLVVVTDGTDAAVESARTAVVNAFPTRWGAITEAEWQADTVRVFKGWKRLANVVVLASLTLAGLSLAVSVAGGLAERRRPFSVLRLTGVPLGTLRRVVALESATPLLTAALVAVGAGLLCAHLFLRAQMDRSLHSPGGTFYLVVLLGVLASLAVIASTMPLLRRITGPEAARND
ncbi:FtsX-like permease family protein [Actinoplanes sp. N902-109]|uniref:FtsX-like permease family protein n=1 Tax=Actinoplanes sp. (strain N902-109) TaxID=649831 RepID=UPI000329539F|nr:FtsX-like permease family protein [Actinoplanes sp. N902-109]AGL19964.1 putative membrane protein [Actinoplanes sp. N902-109]